MEEEDQPSDARTAEAIRLEAAVLNAEMRIRYGMLKTLSHELLTPLNSVLGFTQIVHSATEPPLSVVQTAHLGHVLDSARHLRQLIANVLDLVRLEAGKIDLRPEPLNLAGIVEQLKIELGPLAATNGQTLTTIVEPGIGTVVADLICVRQLIYNFLSNAVKFSAPGEEIVIRFRDDGGDRFRIAVEDKGPGISRDDQRDLFVEFHQLRLDLPARHAGSGLGLAVTRRLVEALGGAFGVSSASGSGSTFFAVLPVRSASAPQPPIVAA